MAFPGVETNLQYWLGTDHDYEFTIRSESDSTVAVDESSFAMSFMVKDSKADADADAIFEKTVGSGIAVSGTHDDAASANTQVTTVTIEDSDTVALAEKKRFWELKRTDAGFEKIMAYGTIDMRKAVHVA